MTINAFWPMLGLVVGFVATSVPPILFNESDDPAVGMYLVGQVAGWLSVIGLLVLGVWGMFQ